MSADVETTEPARAARPKGFLHLGAFRYSAVELLAVLALLFLSAPFIEDLPKGNLLEAVLMTGVMVSAVLAVGGRRRTLLVALLFFLPAFATRWLHHFSPSVVTSLLYPIAALAFFIFVIAHLIVFVLRAPVVNANVLCAGLSGYLLLGLLWVPAYVMVGQLNPGAFKFSPGPDAGAAMNGFNAFYFSFVTLCTVGYGDVTPVSKGARMLAVLEAVAGLFYVAVFISRLVAVYSASKPAAEAAAPDS